MESDKFFYGYWHCIVESYPTENGHIVLELLDAETYRFVRNATVIAPEENLCDNEVIIDVEDDDELGEVLVDAGVLREHIKDINIGRWTYPVYRISPHMIP